MNATGCVSDGNAPMPMYGITAKNIAALTSGLA
jgi:hypothetical protein